MSLLGLDIGTSSAKAIAFNEEGQSIADAKTTYDLIYPGPGRVEFEVEPMWERIFGIFKSLNSLGVIKKDPIEALSVSTFGESFTLIDNKGKPLHNTVYAADTRAINELQFIISEISYKKIYKITGSAPKYISPLSKIYWFKKNKPELFNETKKILFTEDLLFHLLGVGDTKISYSLSSQTLFFDMHKKCWSKEILNKLGLNEYLFSTPSPSGKVIGYIDKAIGEELGFKGKVALVTGGNDQHCTSLGVGAVKPGICTDSIGTFECISSISNSLEISDFLLSNNIPVYCHVVEGKYVINVYNASAGSVIKWYLENIAHGEISEDNKKNFDFYKYLFKGLNLKPSNLFLLPYFAPSGTPYYDAKSKGSIVGLSLSTTRKDIFKALIEGLVFEIALNIELLEKAGYGIEELRAVGGGSRHDYWLRLKCSVLNKIIRRMKEIESGCLGTMILAGTAINKFNIDEALSNFIKINDVFYPELSIRNNYLKFFEAYKRLYKVISEII